MGGSGQDTRKFQHFCFYQESFTSSTIAKTSLSRMFVGTQLARDYLLGLRRVSSTVSH
jgi:hypothetical protein